MKRSSYRYLAAAIALTLIAINVVYADVPPTTVTTLSQIHYQARLRDSSGKPVDEKVAVEVFLYDSAAEGVAGDLNDPHLLYAEKHDGVDVRKGWLRLTIGAGTALGAFSDSSFPLGALATKSALYLELYVGGERISPRQRIDYVPSAYEAGYASIATNLLAAPSITTNNFPQDYSAVNINSGTLAVQRLPLIPATKLYGTSALTASNMPTKIPLSKLKIGDGYIDNGRIPNISTARIQTGSFVPERVPATVLSPDDITVIGGSALNGQKAIYDAAPTNCTCAAAVQSNDGTGIALNTVDVSFDTSSTTMYCNMTYIGGGTIVKDTTPFCNQMPATSSECGATCHTLCQNADFCKSIMNGFNHPDCTVEDYSLNCPMRCSGVGGLGGQCGACFHASNGTPCTGSFLCVCMN